MNSVWTLVDGAPHRLSRRAAESVRSVQSRFDAVWCTGWEERANEHLPGLLGLGPWPVLSFDRALRGAQSHAHWKLAAIDAYAGPDRPLAWIDDAFNPACETWRAARPAPTLLVRTDPADGFTPEQATALAAWADGLLSPR